MGVLDNILEKYPNIDFLKADGFDNAVIGFEVNTFKLVYSITKCLDILVEEGMSDEEAFDYFFDNMIDAQAGEQTPIWIDDNF